MTNIQAIFQLVNKSVRKWHIWFCPTHKPTLRKTKRAIFCPRTNNDTEHLKLNLADRNNIKMAKQKKETDNGGSQTPLKNKTKREQIKEKARTVEINGKQKNYRDREKEILFVDLRRWGQEFEKQFIELTEEDIAKVAENYHNWQQATMMNDKLLMVNKNKSINNSPLNIYHYKDVPEYCYAASFEQIQANDFSLVPSKYIEFIDRDSEIDFDTEMKRIQKDFKTLLQEEKQSQSQLINAFKTLGYEI